MTEKEKQEQEERNKLLISINEQYGLAPTWAKFSLVCLLSIPVDILKWVIPVVSVVLTLINIFSKSLSKKGNRELIILAVTVVAIIIVISIEHAMVKYIFKVRDIYHTHGYDV